MSADPVEQALNELSSVSGTFQDESKENNEEDTTSEESSGSSYAAITASPKKNKDSEKKVQAIQQSEKVKKNNYAHVQSKIGKQSRRPASGEIPTMSSKMNVLGRPTSTPNTKPNAAPEKKR